MAMMLNTPITAFLEMPLGELLEYNSIAEAVAKESQKQKPR